MVRKVCPLSSVSSSVRRPSSSTRQPIIDSRGRRVYHKKKKKARSPKIKMPGGGWATHAAAPRAAALSDPSVHSIESDILVSSRTGSR